MIRKHRSKRYRPQKGRLAVGLLAMMFLFFPAAPQISLAASHPREYEGMSVSYKQSIYYQQLMQVELTGNQVNDLITVANSQMGYREGPNRNDLSGAGTGSGDCTEYGRFLKKNGLPWCASFVSWCFRQADIPESIMPSSAGCGTLRRSVYNNGAAWHPVDSGYQPKAGDLVFYEKLVKAEDGKWYYVYADRDKNALPDESSHVGIVVSDFNPAAGTYDVIDGNGNQGQVKYLADQKLYMAGPALQGGTMNRIQGFVTPAYTTGNDNGGRAEPAESQDVELVCTITFDAAGGEVFPASKEAAAGKTYGDLPSPSRDQYSFLGWFTSPTGGTMVTSDTEVVPNQNQTLYAQWELGVDTEDNPDTKTQSSALVSMTSRDETGADGVLEITADSPKFRCSLIKPQGARLTRFAVYFYTPKGKKIHGYEDDTGASQDAKAEVKPTYTIDASFLAGLIPGQIYSYEFYAVVDGVPYTSDRYSFRVKNDTAKETHTVYFININNMACYGTTTVTNGNPYVLLDAPSDTAGQRFIGWFNGAGERITSDTIVNLTADQNLYARWE